MATAVRTGSRHCAALAVNRESKCQACTPDLVKQSRSSLIWVNRESGVPGLTSKFPVSSFDGGGMYQRIMVAVDGSDTSARGLQRGDRVGERSEGHSLSIIHVVDIVVVFGAGQFPGSYIAATREVARETIERARAMPRLPQDLDPEIQHARDCHQWLPCGRYDCRGPHVTWKADLLVVGTHGRRGISRMLLGSVAERIVRMSHRARCCWCVVSLTPTS